MTRKELKETATTKSVDGLKYCEYSAAIPHTNMDSNSQEYDFVLLCVRSMESISAINIPSGCPSSRHSTHQISIPRVIIFACGANMGWSQ